MLLNALPLNEHPARPKYCVGTYIIKNFFRMNININYSRYILRKFVTKIDVNVWPLIICQSCTLLKIYDLVISK